MEIGHFFYSLYPLHFSFWPHLDSLHIDPALPTNYSHPPLINQLRNLIPLPFYVAGVLQTIRLQHSGCAPINQTATLWVCSNQSEVMVEGVCLMVVSILLMRLMMPGNSSSLFLWSDLASLNINSCIYIFLLEEVILIISCVTLLVSFGLQYLLQYIQWSTIFYVYVWLCLLGNSLEANILGMTFQKVLQYGIKLKKDQFVLLDVFQ